MDYKKKLTIILIVIPEGFKVMSDEGKEREAKVLVSFR